MADVGTGIALGTSLKPSIPNLEAAARTAIATDMRRQAAEAKRAADEAKRAQMMEKYIKELKTGVVGKRFQEAMKTHATNYYKKANELQAINASYPDFEQLHTEGIEGANNILAQHQLDLKAQEDSKNAANVSRETVDALARGDEQGLRNSFKNQWLFNGAQGTSNYQNGLTDVIIKPIPYLQNRESRFQGVLDDQLKGVPLEYFQGGKVPYKNVLKKYLTPDKIENAVNVLSADENVLSTVIKSHEDEAIKRGNEEIAKNPELYKDPIELGKLRYKIGRDLINEELGSYVTKNYGISSIPTSYGAGAKGGYIFEALTPATIEQPLTPSQEDNVFNNINRAFKEKGFAQVPPEQKAEFIRNLKTSYKDMFSRPQEFIYGTFQNINNPENNPFLITTPDGKELMVQSSVVRVNRTTGKKEFVANYKDRRGVTRTEAFELTPLLEKRIDAQFKGATTLRREFPYIFSYKAPSQSAPPSSGQSTVRTGKVR